MPFGINGKINRGRLVAIAENKHKSGEVRCAGSCSWAAQLWEVEHANIKEKEKAPKNLFYTQGRGW